jgi:signal transduction histidine kinase
MHLPTCGWGMRAIDMARRIVPAMLFVISMLPVTLASSIGGEPASAHEIYHSRLLVVVSIAVIESVLIAVLLHSRFKSRSVEAALHQREGASGKAKERISIGGKLIHAQEQERARIARELHDDISQRLALLANGLEKVKQTEREYPSAQLTTKLGELWTLTNDIANDIQHISHQLHPSKLRYLGLVAAVRDLCLEFSRQHGIEVECNILDLPLDLDDTVSLSLFRTIQESLRNVAKHSRAHHVKVELSRHSGQIKLRICDDGIGFNPDHLGENNGHGLGMISMAERLRSAGGQLSIWSRPTFGTRVEGRVPATLRKSRIL